MMKRFFSKVRDLYQKVKWVIRRGFNQLKGHVGFFFMKLFNLITRKTHREAKKQINQDFLKDHLLLEDYDLDLRLDIDAEKSRKEIINKQKELSYKKSDIIPEEILANKEIVKEIYNRRYNLAKQMYDNILEIEYKTDKEIRTIEKIKNFQASQIEELRVAKGREIANLKEQYHLATKTIFLDSVKTSFSNQETSDLAEIYNLKLVKKGLPETRKKLEVKDNVKKNTKVLIQAIIYLAPALLFLVVFTFYPILNAFRLVVYENYNETLGVYEGFTLFGNFKKVLSDANFIIPGKYLKSSAMLNTLLIVVTTVPISIAISLLISVLLNSIKKISNVFQTIFFLPYVTNSLAVGLVFAYMFQTNGLFNKFLNVFNIDGGAWIQHGAPYWKAMFVLILFSIWNGLAFKIMVFLSAIQGIDKQYYQAASIDATPRFKQFRRITAPLISPTILYIVITSVIGAFKTYSSVIAIFGNSGRPAGAAYHLKTIVFYIYDYFNYTGKMPEAAAASIVLFGIILIMTLIQMQVSKKRVHY